MLFSDGCELVALICARVRHLVPKDRSGRSAKSVVVEERRDGPPAVVQGPGPDPEFSEEVTPLLFGTRFRARLSLRGGLLLTVWS